MNRKAPDIPLEQAETLRPGADDLQRLPAPDSAVYLHQSAPQDDWQDPEIGYEIDHFRVVRLLGQGGMGRVLLARDTQLGRLVALKLIREDRVDREALDALRAEAQVTARLSHPNLVTIHHIGHWDGTLYLALEYVDGVTLRERLTGQPLSPREAARLALPIAHALAAAHAALVSHCDLKPENVLVPQDGRLRVVDFGIARVLGARPLGGNDERRPRVAGTPGYMAPEQWVGEEPSGAVDIWALGVMLCEMIAGHRPFEGPGSDGRALHRRVLDPECQPSLPPALGTELRTLLTAMLAREALARPRADEVARALERLLSRDTDEPDEAPFRGLLPFEERHAGFFFGRDAEVDAAVERLRTQSLLPVVGPSGAGKSSFVQAGVLPRLRDRGPQLVLALRPGPRPLAVLAARLAGIDPQDSKLESTAQRDHAQELAARIARQPSHANVVLHELADRERTRVVLFVDQLEEVVTQGCADDEARAFLDAIALAADAVDDQVRVLVTLRDDFLARLAISPAMTAALRNLLVIRRLDDGFLRDAATRPLQRLGYAWEDPAIVDRIVAALRGQPSALPLLQFACAALWERRDTRLRVLTTAQYEQLGGVAGALAAHADAVLDGLPPAELKLARTLLLRLVAADGARRVIGRSEALDGLGESGAALVERLTQARLVTTRRSRAAASGEAVLELAHDALIRDWPQLRRWLEESSEERLLLAEIEDAARVWQNRGRPPGEVWPLPAVEDARRRLRAEAPSLSAMAADFLELGERLGVRRRRRRRWAVGAALGAALLVTITSVAAALAFARKERETKRQAQLIEAAAAERALAAADTGLVELELSLIDWDAAAGLPRQATLADAGQVQVSLWEIDDDDAPQPGRRRDAGHVQWGVPRVTGGRWHAELQTRSGPVLLRVDGRDPRGATCPPSWLALRRLPGWSDRAHGAQPVRVTVPTCAASAAGEVLVPAGEFVLDGAGEPPIAGHLHTQAERVETLPAFAIDRTERSNAWFAAFAGNEVASAAGAPRYPTHMRAAGMDRPDHPVTAVDAHAAAAFCAWLGKSLPTRSQWVKAGRGGLYLDRQARLPNPLPRRNHPWGTAAPGPGFNVDRPGDPWPFTAPAEHDLAGASPYGVLGLTDNVAEWTADPATEGDLALRTVVGGNWGDPESAGLHSLAVSNSRSPRFFAFSLGFRCARWLR